MIQKEENNNNKKKKKKNKSTYSSSDSSSSPSSSDWSSNSSLDPRSYSRSLASSINSKDSSLKMLKKKKHKNKTKKNKKQLSKIKWVHSKLILQQNYVDKYKNLINSHGQDKSLQKDDSIFGTNITRNKFDSKVFPVGTKLAKQE